MVEHWIAVRGQLRHKGFQVAAHDRIGIFAQHQRCACMMDKDVTQTGNNPRMRRNSLYLGRNINSTPATGVNADVFLVSHSVSLLRSIPS